MESLSTPQKYAWTHYTDMGMRPKADSYGMAADEILVDKMPFPQVMMKMMVMMIMMMYDGKDDSYNENITNNDISNHNNNNSDNPKFYDV